MLSDRLQSAILCCPGWLLRVLSKRASLKADFQAASSAAGSLGAEQAIFLPTKCLSLLETLCKARPNHCLLAADFDELPETSIPGKNAPLVASTVSALSLALVVKA